MAVSPVTNYQQSNNMATPNYALVTAPMAN